MNLYNKIMLNFWLFTGIVVTLFVTFMCITDGFKKWGFYFIIAGVAFMMYLVRKFMMKRMEKHLEYLKNKESK